MNKPASCLAYFRAREGDTEIYDQLSRHQCQVQRRLENAGWCIVGAFGDPEFAEPFCGWLEPRGGWELALREAERIAKQEGACSIVVLYADGIGDGDPFLPPKLSAPLTDNINIQLAGFRIGGKGGMVTLEEAHSAFARHQALERRMRMGSTISASKIASDSNCDVVFHKDPNESIVRAYYVNRSDRRLFIEWQAMDRPLEHSARWSCTPGWQKTVIPAESAVCLQSFIQGDPTPKAYRWRFRLGHGGCRRIGNMIATPMDLRRPGKTMRWYYHEPQKRIRD